MLALHKNETFAGRYLLKEIIGARGVSEVWTAEDLLEGNEMVALKIYATLDKSDQHFLERLQQDLEHEQPLQHPHILEIYYFDVYDNTPYIVMPYMAHGSLRSKFLKDGPLTEFEVAVLLKQIGSALQAMHAFTPPQLHQNIKPDNILIAAKDDFILANFWIHNQLKAVLPRMAGQADGNYTAYAPPEQFTVRPGTYEASDIFSFGVTLYELCAGQLPWMGNGGLSLLQGAAVPYLPGSYPRVLNNILTACMDPKWENRPTAEELAQEGNYFIDNGRWKPYGRFSVAKVDVVKYEKRSPLKVALWALGILLLLSALGFLIYTKTDFIQKNFNTVAETPHTTDSSTLTASEVSSNEGNLPEEKETIATTIPKEEELEPTKKVASPAPPVAKQDNTEAEPAMPVKPKAEIKTSPAVKKTAYSRPTTPEQFLAQMQNKAVPKSIKAQWSADIWKFFDRRAAVNYVVNDELIGILSADELLDMMTSPESQGTMRIENVKKNADGKIEQISVFVQEQVAVEESDTTSENQQIP